MRGLLFLIAITMATGSPLPAEDPPKTTPCQTMAQWEGRASEWDHLTEQNNRFIVSFDGIGLRKRVLEEKKSFMPGKRFYEYIYVYKTNTEYKINLDLKSCTVSNLTQPWQNHTIPADATLEDEYEIGAPGSEFRVREWSDRLPARRAESWIGIFTIEGCWPIVEVFTDDDASNPVSLTTRFFDLTPGIQNMSVFDPPSYCDHKYGQEPDMVEFTMDEDSDSNEINMYTVIRKGWDYAKSWV